MQPISYLRSPVAVCLSGLADSRCHRVKDCGAKVDITVAAARHLKFLHISNMGTIALIALIAHTDILNMPSLADYNLTHQTTT